MSAAIPSLTGNPGEGARAMRPIIVIDDHELAHSGIRLLLADSDAFRLEACFTSARDGIDRAIATPDAIVLLDLELPEIDGLAALGEFALHGSVPVIVVTGVTRPEALARASELGAAAIVCKGDPTEELHAALRAVADGERYFSRCAADLIAKADTPTVTLSERQQAILELLAGGCSNKEIGYRLSISPPTVSFHLAEIRRKLGAGSSRQLVDKARAAGIFAAPLT
ncbi:response regulator transcription factor [Tsuneonella amylolytica]|uniref:response regulator transcription factor n=1 Tax=Tsuneonella amylolytica TaxID=2338327 RepID=UPI0013C47A3C|nr:response regulator transcription factor [Tsuneonella amylolytica]